MAESRGLGLRLAVKCVSIVVVDTFGRDNVRQAGLKLLEDLLLLVGPPSINETVGRFLDPHHARATFLLALGIKC